MPFIKVFSKRWIGESFSSSTSLILHCSRYKQMPCAGTGAMLSSPIVCLRLACNKIPLDIKHKMLYIKSTYYSNFLWSSWFYITHRLLARTFACGRFSWNFVEGNHNSRFSMSRFFVFWRLVRSLQRGLLSFGEITRGESGAATLPSSSNTTRGIPSKVLQSQCCVLLSQPKRESNRWPSA